MLTRDEHDYRIGKFTASLACQVMNATSEAALVHIWEQKVGLADPDPENWAMRLGSHCEPLILDERERQTGQPITRRGEIVDHPAIGDVCCKLDGYRAADDAVIECKLTGSYRNREDIARYYYPQISLQMAVTGASRGFLVVAQGTSDPYEIECVRDAEYEAVLLERASAFLLCMKTFTPPCILPPVIPPERWATVDLAVDTPNWGPQLLELLAEFDRTSDAAAAHDEAGRAARGLIPDGIGRVLSKHHVITRDSRGRLTIRSNKQREERE